MKTPTLDEIERAYLEFCKQNKCNTCAFDPEKCRCEFDYKVLTGKLNLDGTPVVAEVEPAKPTLPKWCEVGRWVMDDCGVLCKIAKVDGGQITIYSPEAKLVKCVPDSSKLHPVRFRPYRLEEAKNLLGKVIEFTDEGGHKIAQLVTQVFQNAVNGEVAINGTVCRIFTKNTTIDGLPFGVPEVDEEAMKEEVQE